VDSAPVVIVHSGVGDIACLVDDDRLVGGVIGDLDRFCAGGGAVVDIDRVAAPAGIVVDIESVAVAILIDQDAALGLGLLNI